MLLSFLQKYILLKAIHCIAIYLEWRGKGVKLLNTRVIGWKGFILSIFMSQEKRQFFKNKQHKTQFPKFFFLLACLREGEQICMLNSWKVVESRIKNLYWFIYINQRNIQVVLYIIKILLITHNSTVIHKFFLFIKIKLNILS